MSVPTTSSPCGCSGECGSPVDVDRRGFLRLTGAAAAATALARLPVMAGPFEENEYLRVIQADKRLDPAWVRSLYERGEKQTYCDPKALGRIGMPVGGLFAGTVYLSGDGRLWLWDVFNRDQEGVLPRELQAPDGSKSDGFVRGGANFVHPAPVTQPFEQRFTLEVLGQQRPLDATGFASVTFDGRYPIGRVAFRDEACPLDVDLEAFSPFIPLRADDSSLPVVVLSYRATNGSSEPVTARLAGRMANPVGLDSRQRLDGERRNRVIGSSQFTVVEFSARARPHDEAGAALRPDIRFDDFEDAKYTGWTADGTAFGSGPAAADDVPAYQGNLGMHGARAANSHATAPGSDVAAKDAQTGTLASRSFSIERRYINLLLGGGRHPNVACVNLLIDGKNVASLTGDNSNTMRRRSFDVRQYQGRTAKLEIVDAAKGAWGNIGCDDITFTDAPLEEVNLEKQPDYGTMALALLGAEAAADATASRGKSTVAASGTLADDALVGELGMSFTLAPGESKNVNFLVAWHLPNLFARGCGGANVGHRYAVLHSSAIDVVKYVSDNFERLAGDTRTWVDTWYDSTLPYWFLDRTLATASALATTTCYRFGDGRFWAWEGIGCCEGTCTHVWHYAQALGRLFPEVERDTRTRVDFGIALHSDGGIGHRASLADSQHPADDGQCGRILGVYREHLMSADDSFLKPLWPKVRRAIDFLIRKDGDGDGMIVDAQPNTLDAAWYGKVSFLASLYLAALCAGEQMALDSGDAEYAATCRRIAARGATTIMETYDGEYFAHLEDPKRKQEIGVGPGCYIDQVFGQTWAHWVGLGRLFDRDRQLSALRALWNYNFVPDLGPFREAFKAGRWYAMAGDAGLVMCTWPKGGQNPAFKNHWQAMYFNECMTGFEWQVAAHMIWEGIDQPDLLEHGLAIARAIHDRYSGELRNPYNEIECGDHYARSMASYGAFQAVCGFNCHGPQRRIEFAPRLTPENFRAAFVGPQGWGTFAQQASEGRLAASLTVRHGQLAIKTIGLRSERPVSRALVDGVPAAVTTRDGMTLLTLSEERVIAAGNSLEIEIAH